MFSSKTAGNFYKNSKLITCIVLAICIIAAAFASIPLSANAQGEEVNTKPAIFIGKSASLANTFIPVDIPKAGTITDEAAKTANLYTGDTYFKLTFECKMLSGSKPIVGIMRVRNDSESGAGDKATYSEPSWCNNATSVTVDGGVCTAYFKVNFNNRFNESDVGWRSFYITIGNAEHDGSDVSEKDSDVSFIMSNPKLVTCDSEYNVTDGLNKLPDFDEETINFDGTYFFRSNGCNQWDSPFGSTAMQWHVDSSPALVKQITVPDNFAASTDYDAANFTKHDETSNLREYYTNDKYEGLFFELLSNSNNNGFAVISDDLNKKFVFIDANHQGEEDSTTVDGYKPTKNKVANIFIPLTLGQYYLTGGATTNQKVLVKVTFKATRIDGDGPPVLGRVVGKNDTKTGMDSWAWGLSTINARGSAYYTNYDRSDNGGGVRPQCTYDAATGEYVGWVGFETSSYNTLFGTSEVLTIGNAEHVYQEGTFDSTSFNSSFAISNIKVDLYSTNISGNTITAKALIAEDIAPALNADTVDTENEWYFDYKSGTKSSNHEKDLIRASQNKWHIDGEKSLVSFINTEDIEAYAPKYSVHVKGATGVISAGVNLEANKTYGFTYKNKYVSGTKAKPFVEFITSGGTVKLDTGAYRSDTGIFSNSLISFKTPANLAEGKNVRLGVEIVSVDTDATFGAFELFEIGNDGMMITTKNLLKTVYIKENQVLATYTGDEEIGVWTKTGTIADAGTELDIILCEDSFYYLPGTPQMLMFEGKFNKVSDDDLTQVSYGDGDLYQSLRIEKDKKYRFSANLKWAATGYKEDDVFGLQLTYRNKNSINKTLTEYTDLSDNSKYLIEYEFNSPSSLRTSGTNFKVSLKVPNGFVSGYFANVKLVEIDEKGNEVGDNLIVTGNFIDGDYSGWTRNGDFKVFKFCDIPENFFSTNPTQNIHAFQYRDPADYGILQQQNLLLKPGVRYELGFTALITGKTAYEPYGVIYQRVFNKDKTDTSWGNGLRDNEKDPLITDYAIDTTKTVLNEQALRAVQGGDYDPSETVDHAIRVTKVFKTDENTPIYQSYNTSIRYYLRTDASGYVSDYQLYEIESTGKTSITFTSEYLAEIGDGTHTLTLIDNSNKKVSKSFTVKDGKADKITLSFDGFDIYDIRVDDDSIDKTKYAKTDYYKRISNNVMLDGDFSAGFQVLSTSSGISNTPWNFTRDADTRNIELEKGFFENYTVPAKIIRSDGSAANQTYGNQLFVDPGSTYYFSGKYIKTNFAGITPEVLYRSISAGGEYVKIPIEQYYDANRYYFETKDGFTIPDDALINSDGKADIIVRVNNLDHGKGYFSSLTLTQDYSSKNLFSDSKASLGKFIEIKYDPEIFQPFEGDERFEDGNWSGEAVYTIETGSIIGIALDNDGYTLAGIVMKLKPGNQKTITDENGVYKFDNLKPGKYSLYLVEDTGNEIFCTDITVKAGYQTILPDLYYSTGDDGDGDIYFDDEEEIKERKYGALKGYCYDASGKLLSGVDIYVNSKSHHTKTNSKGIFMFDQVPPGEYKICTVLDDGSVYVFRTVKIEAGKGTVIRVMMPDDGFPIWLWIVIIAGGVLVLAGAALAVILLVLKNKKKKQIA